MLIKRTKLAFVNKKKKKTEEYYNIIDVGRIFEREKQEVQNDL